MTGNFIGFNGASQGSQGGTLPTPTENAVLRGDGTRWVTETTAMQLRSDGVDLGTDDDHYHNIQGRTTIYGDYDDILLTVVGHSHVDRLNVLDYIRINGGQYPSYYGYGAQGNQYPGAPYWGSYPDDAVGPQHGTGTTIDQRGLRTDEIALLERGFMCYDAERDDYLIVRPVLQGDGSIEWEAAQSDTEPNV